MKPKLFIGSSSEEMRQARALQTQLESSAEVTVWDQGFFALNKSYLESLIDGLNDTDFGVLVFVPDDIVNLRGEELKSVRDNVLFELGLSMGKLGRERAFFVLPEDHSSLRLPTDLLGISTVTFDAKRQDKNIQAALGPACFKIGEAIDKHGVRRERLGPSEIEIKIAQERERVRNICARITGAWWERIAGDGIGFFHIQMDELHNSVQLVEGHFYNEEGSLTAHWNSAAARIEEENSRKGIVYLRECRVPARDPKSWFHGYGDMWFEGSNESFSQGYGTFYDVNRDDPQKTLARPVELRRINDANEISIMQNGTATDSKSLVLRMISAW